MDEIESQRFFENHLIDALAKLGAQQRLAEGNATLRRRHRGDQQAFESDQPEYRSQLGRLTRPHKLGGRNDRIDDMRADPGNPGRQ